MGGDSDEGIGAGSAPQGWHSRGYIPHYDVPGLIQLLTIRLHDSMPAARLAQLNRTSGKLTPVQIRSALENHLDAGYGACYLRDPRVASLAQETLLHFDGERYNLLAWVVMPNHVHTLLQLRAELPVGKVMQSWKGYIARFSNQLLGRSGDFWQRDYFDRFISNEDHYRNAVLYIEGNPVKARLVSSPEQWPYSSARMKSVAEKSAPLQ